MSEFRYLKEKARMLKFLGRNGYCTRDICKKCRLSAAGDQHEMSCETFEIEYPEEAEAIVRKWAQEHPAPKRKTRKDVLLEKSQMHK